MCMPSFEIFCNNGFFCSYTQFKTNSTSIQGSNYFMYLVATQKTHANHILDNPLYLVECVLSFIPLLFPSRATVLGTITN